MKTATLLALLACLAPSRGQSTNAPQPIYEGNTVRYRPEVKGPDPTLSRIPGEPYYKGKPLCYWIDVFSIRIPTGHENIAQEEKTAHEAIKALGLPAVEFMLRYTPIDHSQSWVAVIMATNDLMPDVQRVLVTALNGDDERMLINAMGCLARSVAKEVAPQLQKLAADPRKDVRSAAQANMVRLGVSPNPGNAGG